MTNRRPTIDDVAAAAGVARVTVSRVLNGAPNVRDTVRGRVMAAVEALDYRVNVQARGLASGASRTIALICGSDLLNEPNSYYHSGLEIGALHACSAAGLHLLTRLVDQRTATRNQEVVELAAAHRCAGLVLTPPFSDDAGLVQALGRLGVATVCVSPGPDSRGLTDGVGIDDEAAGHEVTAHLLGLGHRRFGFVRGIAGHLAADRRYAGARRALREAGLGEGAMTAVRGNFTFRSGIDLLPGLLDGAAPTAVICANDDMAAGALFAAHRAQLAIPAALSLTGFDDTPVSAIVWPPLTTVRQPIRDMGEQAVGMLATRLNGRTDEPARYVTVPHRLIVRATTAAPPG